jgi:hypothetical protein
MDNRKTVRKWLTSQGFPSMFAGGLSMRELAGAYNDVSGAAIAALQKKMAETADDENESFPQPAAPTTPQAGETADGKPARAQSVGPAKPLPADGGVLPGMFDSRMMAVIAGVMAALPPAVDVPAIEKQILASCADWLAKNSMSEAAVRAFIADELPKHVPTIKVEVKTPAIVIKTEGPRHKQFPELLQCLADGVHVMLVGPAGSGKTSAVHQAAEALGKPFYLQGAVSGAHELLGYCDAQGRYQSTPFRAAFECSSVACLDELDGGDAAGLLVANAALANSAMAFPDNTLPVKRHEGFVCVATANTFGTGADRLYVGRNQLDAATLDRFWFMNWGYDEKLERIIAGNDSWVDRVQALRRGADKEKARVVISPRASIIGAKRLASGATRDQCEQALIWKGIDPALRSRIEESAR